VGLPIYERMSNSDFEVFDGKSFKDLCKDVVERSQNKKDQLDTLISDIRNQIKQPNDIQVFMPRIKELLEVGVKNDEQIIKLCAVVQRMHSTQVEATGGGDSTGLSDEEKEQLMNAKIRELEKLNAIKKEVEAPILTPVK
jgi:hypothetical protein